MTDKEIKELQDRTYAIGWSGFPIDTLFNDIRDNNNPRFNKDLAYQDFKKIVDEIYRLRALVEAWEIAKNKSVDLYDVKTSQDTEEFNCDLYKDYQLTEDEFCKLKNALGVENELHSNK